MLHVRRGTNYVFFREKSTGFRRRFIDVRAAHVKLFYKSKDHFSRHLSFFYFPEQYERLGNHVETAIGAASRAPQRCTLMGFAIRNGKITEGDIDSGAGTSFTCSCAEKYFPLANSASTCVSTNPSYSASESCSARFRNHRLRFRRFGVSWYVAGSL